MTTKRTQAKTHQTSRTVKTESPSRRGRRRSQTKKQIALALLRRAKGASIAEMQKAMDWKEHSVRGFLAGTVKKMPGVILVSEKGNAGPRRYRIEADGA